MGLELDRAVVHAGGAAFAFDEETAAIPRRHPLHNAIRHVGNGLKDPLLRFGGGSLLEGTC
jgi:hypothetical protein